MVFSFLKSRVSHRHLRLFFEEDRKDELFKILSKENVNRKDNEGFYPVDVCIAYSSSRAVFEYLLNLGINVDRVDDLGFNLLHTSANFKKAEFISALLDRKFDPYAETKRKQSALLIASTPYSPDLKEQELDAENEKINKCILLLSKFPRNFEEREMNSNFYNGATPLETVVNFNNFYGVEILLKAGALIKNYSEPPIVNFPSQTIMHNAVYQGRQYLELLLKFGGNKNEVIRRRGKYVNGKQLLRSTSLLDYAIERQDSESIKLLIDIGAKTWDQISSN